MADSDDICIRIEEFSCLMFGDTSEKRINEVRGRMLRKMFREDDQLTIKSKFDLSKLFPAEEDLNHIYIVETTT